MFRRALCLGIQRRLVCEARAVKQVGGAEGNRTPDLLIANEALYHLSYGPFPGKEEGGDKGWRRGK